MGLLRSSTFWRGGLFALLAALPTAVAFLSLSYDVESEVLGDGLGGLEELEAELAERLWELEHGDFEDLLDLERSLEIEEIEGESFARFLARYATALHRAHQEFRRSDAVDLRLALLGELDSERLADASIDPRTLPPLAMEAVVEQILDETPETFHESLVEWIDGHFELDRQPTELTALASEALARRVSEVGGELWEDEIWLWVEDPRGTMLAESPGPGVEVDRLRSAALLLRVEWRDVEDMPESWDQGEAIEPRWFLARERTLADGGRVRFGLPFDESWNRVRRGRWLRWAVWGLLLPWCALLAARQARPMLEFLATLHEVARRQMRGRAGSRLRTRDLDRDLAGAASTLNKTLDHLDHSVQALSRVTDSIAHDLRTPLSRLQGQLDLLRRHPEPSGEMLDGVQAEADQLLSTFNALLRIAQVESGHKKQGFRRFDLAETVSDVAELYAPVFAEKGVAFEWQVPERTFDSVGDRDLWLQALSNLVENALKYTPRGGRVDLQLETRVRRSRIVLRDSGPGIPKSERDNVFQRFYRLERHRGERGNGLGLSLVAAVCELHEADIALDGEGGLTVTIELPRLPSTRTAQIQAS